MSTPCLLTLNAGSSPLKFAIYEAGPQPLLRLAGEVSNLGATPRPRAREVAHPATEVSWNDADGLDAVLDQTLAWLGDAGWTAGVQAVGHRIVHGGLGYRQPTVLSAPVLRRLETLVSLAPLHQPFNLRGVAMAAARFRARSVARDPARRALLKGLLR